MAITRLNNNSITSVTALPSGIDVGKIGQIQTSNLTTHYTINTSSFADIGLSCAITPTATSSKILILYKLQYSNASGEGWTGRLVRDSTNIALGTGNGTACTVSFATANANNYWSLEAGGSFLDSPNTTSATTYKFQASPNSGTYTMYFNRTARGDSADPSGIMTLTLMEVLA